MKKALFGFVIPVMLSACGGQSTDKVSIHDVALDSTAVNAEISIAGNTPVADQAIYAAPAVNYGEATNTEVEKKVIKEGEMRFETEDVADTRTQLLTTLKKLGGYVTEDNEYLSGNDNHKQYVLNIRVPSNRFDTFLGTVSSAATKIDSKNIRATDITTQYIDVKTRLDNKKALEKRYLALLDKAAKMSDVLEIEAKLADIRSDIESTQGQLNYMDKQVAYSSLSITFYTKQAAQVDSGYTFGYKFNYALTAGLLLLQQLFFGLISCWPILILFAVIIFIIRKRKRTGLLR